MPRMPITGPRAYGRVPKALAIIPYKFDPPRTYKLPIYDNPVYDPYTQIFSYTRPGEETIHIHVGDVYSRIAVGIIPRRYQDVQLTPHMVNHVRENSGVELSHLGRITKQQMREPGLLLNWGKTQTIIDGSHRVVLRFLEQHSVMTFLVVRPDQVRKSFLDLPQDWGLDEPQRGWGDRHDEKGDWVSGEDGTRRKANGELR